MSRELSILIYITVLFPISEFNREVTHKNVVVTRQCSVRAWPRLDGHALFVFLLFNVVVRCVGWLVGWSGWLGWLVAGWLAGWSVDPNQDATYAL